MSLDIMVYAPGQAGAIQTIAGDQASMEAVVQAGTLAFRGITPSFSIGYNADGQSLSLPQNVLGFYGTFFFILGDGQGGYLDITEDHRGSIEGLVRSNASFAP